MKTSGCDCSSFLKSLSRPLRKSEASITLQAGTGGSRHPFWGGQVRSKPPVFFLFFGGGGVGQAGRYLVP